MKNILGIVVVVGLMSGCVPITPKPSIKQPVIIQPNLGLGTSIRRPEEASSSSINTTSAYGLKPNHYPIAIKNYFSTKLTRGESGKYKFGEPKRAYKQKGFAYGGELDWKGWLVETSVATTSRTGRYLTPKPYMVLFKGEQIVDHILGNSHKLLTKVDK